ncbi:hypothetical protein [Nonomuraea dietziae]|uniref:hypothetical protein n=1 Tax=Nonomuraea dietziae TaxID=65515 RepID=UPI0033F886FC
MRPSRDPFVLLFTGAVALASLLTLIEASTPGLSFWVLALALYWVALAIATAWFARVREPGTAERAWKPWMFAPVALVLGTVLLVGLDAPLHARFALSEPSLERHARSVRDDHDSNRWWGLYRVDHVEKIPGERGSRSPRSRWTGRATASPTARIGRRKRAGTNTSRAPGTSGARDPEGDEQAGRSTRSPRVPEIVDWSLG